MKKEIALDVALDVLTKYHENEGFDSLRSRNLAYAYLFGALSVSVTNKRATEILEAVFNNYSPKEKVNH